MIKPFLKSIWRFSRSKGAAWRNEYIESRLPARLAAARRHLATIRASGHLPRIVVVKQDINEDLYCCPAGSTAREIVESTLLRTGQVCLFADWDAEFRIIETVDDPECSIWQERATQLKWSTLDFFRSYRDLIPGRDYGQKRFATTPDAVDWSHYDIVISIDTTVPARITRRFPNTLWCYYVRELKAPASTAALQQPHAGQDIVLNHYFRQRIPPLPPHVIEFPYHLQSPGCFHRLFDIPIPRECDRAGVFVDHHTMVKLPLEGRRQLEAFGPLSSPFHGDDDASEPAAARLPKRTMDPGLRERLLNARYFLVTPGTRPVFGTAVVEAIAAGCLAIGSARNVGCGEFFTENTVAENFGEALTRMRALDQNQEVYRAELQRQRNLVEYLCYARPMLHLLQAASEKRTRRAT